MRYYLFTMPRTAMAFPCVLRVGVGGCPLYSSAVLVVHNIIGSVWAWQRNMPSLFVPTVKFATPVVVRIR